MAVDPEHAPAPFPRQTQGRVQRLFERSRPETREWPVGESDEGPWYRDPWIVVTVVLLGAIIGIAVGLASGPWPR